jgi:RHS repeat-associated protein
VHGRKVTVPAVRAWHLPAAAWPAAGTATVSLRPAAAAAGERARALAGPSAGSALAGRLPLKVGPAVTRGTAAALPSRVRATMASRQAAKALGVGGVVFTLARSDGKAAPGRVHVSLDYSSFAYADGGNYAARLRLVQLPSCALTNPQRPACRVQTPLASADDVRTDELGADVTLPAAAPSAGAVIAATTSTSGSSGSYSATPMAQAGNWAQGGSSGAFLYSYPIQVPPVPGGLEPDVSLGYNSQEVDGLTSSTNTQASWIGDGWDYSPGYVQRDYQSCEQNSGSEQTGDFCWSSSDTVTLSLNGDDTTLVQDGSTGAWRPEDDNGEKVQYETGTSNGTFDGDYWVITTMDGTKYYFGLNQLPGYASGDAATNSTWTLPVFAAASGQPCYDSTWADSYCTQGWRWNLDYVVDPHGDAVAYFYNTETNYYARDNGTTANTPYTQAGALTKIEYGLRAGAVYSATPAAQVNFTTGTSRTDVPTDLSCSNGASCDVASPTFWSKYQLTSISTQALEGSSLTSVDSWALSQTYLTTGDPTTPAALWLASITRTGEDGTAVSLPPVSFTGTGLVNRVESPADETDGYSLITRFRIHTITSETGGVTTVSYDTGGGACTSGNFPAPDANTDLCYPDYWTPPGTAGPIEDWFNKYVVDTVTQQDTTGGGVPVQTSYSYSGAAWHYNDDSLTRSQQRTWDQWRGFRTVTTETGTSPDPITKTTDTYFQGMNGDYQSGGGTSSVTLTSTRGDTVTDSDALAGTDFESIVYDGAGAGEVSDTITIPWLSAATATQSQPSPLPSLTAQMTGVAETKVYTALASGGNRESDTSYTHDSYGRVTTVSNVPDTSDASEDTCTTTTYASNTSNWILDLAAEVQVVSVPCGSAVSLPADAVSDKLTFYDGATSLGADTPTTGNVTETQLATSYSGSAPVYTTESAATYDEYGRTLTSTDADNRMTTTAYTPATGAEPTATTVTDPLGLVTTTAYDPARDLPTKVTNPASYVTTETYDALGRLTAVWLPGHPQGTQPASETFSYDVSDTAASVVTTDTVNDTGGYTTSEALYDSLGRPVETQDATLDGGRDVTDTYYNSDGWQQLVSNSYYTTGAPNVKLVGAPDDEVPSQTGYVYDGAGRVTQQISYKFATETWETDTSYGGDYTTVTPPQGGTAQTTFTDGRGLTSAIYQYHAGAAPNPADPASDYDDTLYTYNPAKQLATIDDAAGNTWSYGYNLAGNRTSEADPDAGSSKSAYDAAGQLMSVTDARGKTISYTYDADGRKAAEYDTTGGATESSSDEIASWTYDTLKKGMLSSSSSYYTGAAFTEQVLGYDVYEESEGTKTVIPSTSQTGALAGTYETQDGYDTYTGELSSYYDTAAGGLPAETVNIGYNTANDPVSVSSTIGDYVASLSYTELNQPQEYTLGTTNDPVTVTDAYDQQTQRLISQVTVAGSGTGTTVDDTAYTYDDVGNVTSEADTPAGDTAATQVQCFKYDYLGRLTEAWSQGSSGCPASSPSASGIGGAQPYLEQLSYDVTGNITTNESTYGAPGAQSTVDDANSYPAAGQPGPHQLTSQKITSSSSGSSTATQTYDADGNLATVTTPTQSESMTWDDAGRLSSVTTTPAGSATTSTTTYLYDADGNLLLQADPGSTTLYVGDEQIVADTAASPSTLSATRYYSIGGATIAARTSSGTVDYLIGDTQGTSQLAINASTLSVTRRYFGPYGTELDSPPATFPGDKGFVGGTTDPATSLTNLGAREYSPANGQFISPDPLLNPANPQDLNPYAYAADNPSTNSDPSGAMFCNGGGYCGGGVTVNHGHPAVSGGPAPNLPPAAGAAWYNPTTGKPLKPALMPGPSPTKKAITNGSAAGTDCPTGVASRFAGPSTGNCTPGPSTGGGGGGAFLTAALRFAGNVTGISDAIACAEHPTLGDCLSAALKLTLDAATIASLGGTAELDVAADAGSGALRFTQTTASATFRNGPFAGRTLGDVADALRSGAIKPSELSVDLISRGENSLIMNTRSSLALLRGGVNSADWVTNDVTGDPFFEQVLDQRLASNGLTDQGTDVLRITGAGQSASWLG